MAVKILIPHPIFFPAPHFETPLLDQHPTYKRKRNILTDLSSDFTFVIEGTPFRVVVSLG